MKCQHWFRQWLDSVSHNVVMRLMGYCLYWRPTGDKPFQELKALCEGGNSPVTGVFFSQGPIDAELRCFLVVNMSHVATYQIAITHVLQCTSKSFNTLRPRQNGRHFADDMFKCIFLNENVWIPIEISPKFVPKGSMNNNPAFFFR